MVVFLLIPFIFITNLLSKHFVNKIGRRYIKNVQRKLFEQLLNSALIDKVETQLSQILNAVMDNNLFGKLRQDFAIFKNSCLINFSLAFQLRSSSLYIWSVLTFTFFLSIMANGFVFFVVFVPVLDVGLRIRKYLMTIQIFGHLERESRLKLLHLVSNQLKGRVVIQSFDNVQKVRGSVYKAIEENCTAVYIGQSTIFYNQVLFMLWQGSHLLYFIFKSILTMFLSPFSIYVGITLSAADHLPLRPRYTFRF